MILRRDALLALTTAPFLPAAPRVTAASLTAPDELAVASVFAAHGVTGALVLHDAKTRATLVHGGALATERFPPCSTFKIPNALFALDTGVAPDDTFTLPWNKKPYDRAAWNRDHDLASAIRHSVVWYFQEIARRIGLTAMRTRVAALGYGNGDVGSVVDRFWLDGPLAISATEQLDFIKRFDDCALPIARKNVDAVRALLVKEKTARWTLSGKTGLGDAKDGRVVGWLVGTFERADGGRWHYATLLLGAPGAYDPIMPKRRDVTMDALTKLGIAT